MHFSEICNVLGTFPSLWHPLESFDGVNIGIKVQLEKLNVKDLIRKV